jgi:CDP-4-dehydro-6-deoxyglucose reductase
MNREPVRVTLTDGESFVVAPGETVLAAALRAGVFVPYSCQSGTCRTCYSRVVTGRIEHDPEYADELFIDADEVAAGYRLLCSSFAFVDSVVEIGG